MRFFGETNLNCCYNVQSFECLSIATCGDLSHPEASGEFSSSRAQATTCRACLPGMYSIPLNDGEATYMCMPCPEGTQQLGAGAVVCDPCPVGTSKAEASTAECQPCTSGFYQDEQGKAGFEVVVMFSQGGMPSAYSAFRWNLPTLKGDMQAMPRGHYDFASWG